MSTVDQDKFISQLIIKLSVSEDFKQKSKKMGFSTIRDIVETAPQVLIKMEHFDYTWLAELTAFLKKNGALDLLQISQGNSRI